MKIILFIMLSFAGISFFKGYEDDEKQQVCVDVPDTFGPEVIDQVRWCEVGLAYWDTKYINPGFENPWHGDGAKLSCVFDNEHNQGSGNIGKTGLLDLNTWYRAEFDCALAQGWIELFAGLGGYWFQDYRSGHFVVDFKTDPVSCWGFYIDASGMGGIMTSLSVKKILTFKKVCS
jgi:hypothetical protein